VFEFEDKGKVWLAVLVCVVALGKGWPKSGMNASKRRGGGMDLEDEELGGRIWGL